MLDDSYIHYLDCKTDSDVITPDNLSFKIGYLGGDSEKLATS